MGLRSPVSCANPTTSEEAMVFDKRLGHADREILEIENAQRRIIAAAIAP